MNRIHPRAVRVMDLNLWNVNPPLFRRMLRVKQGVERSLPDILCFQEVSMIDGEPQFSRFLDGNLYDAKYAATGSWMGREEGLAIAWTTDFNVTDVSFERLPHKEPDMNRGVLAVDLRRQGVRIVVATTHLAYRPEDRELRVVQAMGVCEHLERRHKVLSRLLILCGDFNDVPGSGIPELFVDRLGVYDAQEAAGLGDVDTFSSANDYVDPRLVPDRRIDYVMPSSGIDLKDFRLAMASEENVCSDHYALIADVEL